MSSPTLALVPAKRTSTGVPDKNWKPITPDGRHCSDIAVRTAALAGIDRTVLSTDIGLPEMLARTAMSGTLVQRPPDLPDTMLAVVQDALQQVAGPDDEIIVLLQPTSPLRTPETVRKAIQMLEDDPDATSVVSVSPSHPVEWTLWASPTGILRIAELGYTSLGSAPARRQDCQNAYRRDGVVYAFRRYTLMDGDIYGECAVALHTPPAESLSIDTPEDWDEAVRRLALRASSAPVEA